MVVPEDARRLHPRIAVEALVSLVDIDSGARSTAVLSDLSAGGMSFYTEAPVEIGAEVEVGIVPPLAITPPLYARAQVLRCVPANGQYRVAVATHTMDSAPSV